MCLHILLYLKYVCLVLIHFIKYTVVFKAVDASLILKSAHSLFLVYIHNQCFSGCSLQVSVWDAAFCLTNREPKHRQSK